MKRLVLFLLLLAPVLVRAQTNTARMLNGVNAQTGTNYTFVCTDATMLVTFNNPSPVSATLFAATDPCSGPGIMFSVKNIGSGIVTITPATGTINGGANLILQPLQGADIWNDGINYTSEGSISSGPPPAGFPRLDQVTDPNVDKAFNLGVTNLSFFNGNFSLAGTNLVIPNSAGCVATLTAQECLDLTLLNDHLWNGTDNIVALFPVASTFTNGDVLGVSVVAGQQTLQDLAPVNASSGNTFWLVNMTTPLDGDIPCWDTTGPPFSNNCTPGAVDTSIAGATNSYTISLADQLTTIDHDAAGSQSVAITLPTADTLGLNPGFVFIYSNHSTHTDTITPTTWTINGSVSLTVATNSFCRIRVDPASATNWFSDCSNSSAAISATSPIVLTAGNISCPTCGTGSGNLTGTLSAPHIPVATGANALADSTVTDDGTAPTRTPNGANTALSGVYDEWVVDTGGVTANKLVCRSSNSKVQICATSITQGVIGVAQATATSGQTVKVCWAAKCSPISSNATTAGHWLIPSTTVAGDVDDTGSTTQPTGTDTFLAESTVGGGAQVLTTLLAADTVNANGGGKPNTIQINGTNTQPVTNFNGTTPVADANNQLLVHKFSNSGNTTSASVEVPLATTGQAGIVQLAGALNGTSASPGLASPYNKLRCETGLGDGLNAMAAGTYLQFFCVNTSGSTWTITGINCWTDNAGTSTLNAANNAGTGLLTGAVTCNATKSGGGAAGTQSGTTTLANNDAISFTFVADGTSKQTTWTVSMTQ